MRERLKNAVTVLALRFGLSALQTSGLALIAIGLFTLAPWLGLVASGVILSVVGWALDDTKQAEE